MKLRIIITATMSLLLLGCPSPTSCKVDLVYGKGSHKNGQQLSIPNSARVNP